MEQGCPQNDYFAEKKNLAPFVLITIDAKQELEEQ
jgi:hypothetical protein